MTTVTQQDDGASIRLRVGEEIRIRLPENASTGYRWAVDRIEGGQLVAASAEPLYPAGPPGSTGEACFTFRAIGPGQGAVALKQWRHWEGDGSIIARFHVTVAITR